MPKTTVIRKSQRLRQKTSLGLVVAYSLYMATPALFQTMNECIRLLLIIIVSHYYFTVYSPVATVRPMV